MILTFLRKKKKKKIDMSLNLIQSAVISYKYKKTYNILRSKESLTFKK